MVQWKLVCTIAALYALGTVETSPIGDDVCDTADELVLMDDNFPGHGAALRKGASPTSGTLSADTSSGGGKYNPGLLHAPLTKRRLELTRSVDMKKLESYFSVELEIDITILPTKCGISPAPWPSSYWPSFADGINYEWSKKSASPSEKYATAFGHDVVALMDKISAKRGIDSAKKRKKCTEEHECAELNDGSVCSKRKHHKSGYCIPKWFGICHAWAPAAILEPEPVCAVERNGVLFEPYDIKALITMVYDGAKIPTIFTGSRCNTNDKNNQTDEYGRYEDARRRDVSPSLFHIVITNVMCLFNHSFVIDISAGVEVWNQPARSFEILRMSWMTPTQAAKKYFNLDKYPFNDAATKIAVVTTRFSWVAESGVNGPLVSTGRVDKYTKSADYHYILETDETYQILGGEWIGESRYNHIDFAWLPAHTPDNSTVTAEGIVYAEVKSLLEESLRENCEPQYSRTQPRAPSAGTTTAPPGAPTNALPAPSSPVAPASPPGAPTNALPAPSSPVAPASP